MAHCSLGHLAVFPGMWYKGDILRDGLQFLDSCWAKINLFLPYPWSYQYSYVNYVEALDPHHAVD